MNALRVALIALLIQAVPVPRETTASIEGIVVDVESQRPIAGAVVEVTGLAERDFKVLSFSTRTSTDGRFVIEGIPPGGAYNVVATNTPNFLPAAFGQKRSEDPWTSIALTAGQRVTGIRISMVELSGISGRVADLNGNGIRDVFVAVLNLSYRGDGWRLLQSNKVVRTNASGEYRIPGLSTGRYIVRVGPQKRRSSSEGTYLYYPAESDPTNAVPVEVSGTTPVEAVDFVVSETDTYRVGGSVIDATGRTVRDARVFLVLPKVSPDSSAAREITSRDGDFEFRDVAPGQYQLFAVNRDSSRPMSGRILVSVSNLDLQNVTLPIRSDFEVAGRFTIEDPSIAGPVDFSQLSVRLNPGSRATIDTALHGLVPEDRTDSVLPVLRSAVGVDGTFVIKGVRSWGYVADVLGTPKLYVKAILMGGKDLLRDSFDLTDNSQLNIILAADSGELAGRVSNGNGHPMAHATVALVPDEPFRARRDLYRIAQSDASGRFTFPVIAPGNYKVFSWRGVDPGAWYFPEFLKNDESRAVPVVIRPSTATTVDVTLLSDNPHLR